MNRKDIDEMAADMAADMRRSFGATGDGMDRCIRAWLMDAIRQTEDEAKVIAYECAHRIGAARKAD